MARTRSARTRLSRPQCRHERTHLKKALMALVDPSLPFVLKLSRSSAIPCSGGAVRDCAAFCQRLQKWGYIHSNRALSGESQFKTLAPSCGVLEYLACRDTFLAGPMGGAEMMKWKRGFMEDRVARAAPHGDLADPGIHVFVDDQNLFWGITKDVYGKSYRIDFGRLLLATAKDASEKARPVKTAYIAGVIPDDDYFWEVARNKGFELRKGYLGTNNRSKQDDA